uniref:Uncharacterized protein n=1 Tax=Meloidogyne enterolobii TaxID=390850 RepID=A0A6V7WJU0_MELEN|nr:unnamed protein product [Meloidogyne enterolobii]
MDDRTRTEPRFAVAIWSVYARTLNGGDRTNNFAEAAHRRLQRAFGCDHPSLWRFIDTLRREQKNTDADYTQFTLGRDPPLKAKKYRDADRRIYNLVVNYAPLIVDQNGQINFEPNDFINFLTGISRNYEMNQ